MEIEDATIACGAAAFGAEHQLGVGFVHGVGFEDDKALLPAGVFTSTAPRGVFDKGIGSRGLGGEGRGERAQREAAGEEDLGEAIHATRVAYTERCCVNAGSLLRKSSVNRGKRSARSQAVRSAAWPYSVIQPRRR
jgi:hypothetical protein